MIKPKKPKKLHSMRNQIAAIFIGLLFVSIVAISGINAVFLEKYYITKKSDVILETMADLEGLEVKKQDDTERSGDTEETFTDGT